MVNLKEKLNICKKIYEEVTKYFGFKIENINKKVRDKKYELNY